MSNFTFSAERPLMEYKKKDSTFIICVLLLWGLGIVTLLICSQLNGILKFENKYHFVFRQLKYSVIAFVALTFFALVPMSFIRKCVVIATGISLFLCLLCFVPGLKAEINGATRWVKISSSISFQPSEFVKFAIILYLSHLFVKHEDEYKVNNKEFLYPLFVLLLFVLVILAQKDFSTAFIVFSIGTIMFIISGANISWIVPFLILAIPAVLLLIFTEPYRLLRIQAFLKPNELLDGLNYQRNTSLKAISDCGFFGRGMGSDLNAVIKIPEVESDYIFASWTSSMGLLGVSVYFILIIIFTWKAFQIALTCPNKFAAYGSMGCAILIAIQSLVNIAVVCGLLPTTGIPLPFFSSGGTSLIVTLAMCGFIINASNCYADDDYRVIKKVNDNIESFNGVIVENE